MITLYNFVFMPSKDFTEVSASVKEEWQKVKDRFDLIHTECFVFSVFPYLSPKSFLDEEIANGEKYPNLVLSNMTGPLKAPWVFKGKKVDWVS